MSSGVILGRHRRAPLAVPGAPAAADPVPLRRGGRPSAIRPRAADTIRLHHQLQPDRVPSQEYLHGAVGPGVHELGLGYGTW